MFPHAKKIFLRILAARELGLEGNNTEKALFVRKRLLRSLHEGRFCALLTGVGGQRDRCVVKPLDLSSGRDISYVIGYNLLHHYIFRRVGAGHFF